MPKRGKKYENAVKLIEHLKPYPPTEAISLAKQASFAKFDETVELHLRTGLDPRHADQQLRGTTLLPHGLGKTVRVLVFAEGEARATLSTRARTSWAPTTSSSASRTAGWTSTSPWPPAT